MIKCLLSVLVLSVNLQKAKTANRYEIINVINNRKNKK
nr:MAG TPA: hypothetical protein [Caudoviricetes sp.]